MTTTLRQKLIRLAYEKKNLRGKIIPLLTDKQAATTKSAAQPVRGQASLQVTGKNWHMVTDVGDPQYAAEGTATFSLAFKLLGEIGAKANWKGIGTKKGSIWVWDIDVSVTNENIGRDCASNLLQMFTVKYLNSGGVNELFPQAQGVQVFRRI